MSGLQSNISVGRESKVFQNDKAQRLGLLLIRCSTLAAVLVVLNAGVLFGLGLADAPRRYEVLAIPILVVLPVACFLWLLGTFVLCLVPDNRAKISFALGLLASLLMTSCFDLGRWADLVGHDNTPRVFSVATCAAIVLVLTKPVQNTPASSLSSRVKLEIIG